MLSKILLEYPKFLGKSDIDKIKIIQSYTKNQLSNIKVNNKLNYNKNINNLFKIGSIDLGNKNLCSLTFNDNSEAILITSNNYFKTINKIDSKIDKRKAEINIPVLREIQSQFDLAKNNYHKSKIEIIEQIKLTQDYLILTEKTKKEIYLNAQVKEQLVKINIVYPKLSKQDKILLEECKKNCKNDSYLIKQQSYKNNYIDDYVHKLSTKILSICLIKCLDYLIIGKNDLWKQASELGKVNNRAFHNFPHTELIEKLKYKALKFGIVVLITEESYTSKTSFINNVELKVYNKNEEKDIKLNKEVEINSINKKPRNKPLLSSKMKAQSYGGYRKNRDVYVNKIFNIENDLPKLIHADINGSYNHMRKIFVNLKYEKEHHNIGYKIVNLCSHSKKLNSILKK